jgi:hypothetical protein
VLAASASDTRVIRYPGYNRERVPIRPELRHFYDSHWRTYRLALIAIHGSRCSACKRAVQRYLNLAHLTHDPRSSSVALMCPACHNRHDSAHRLAIWRRNRARRAGQLWLMPELEYAPYPAWMIPRGVSDSRQEVLFVEPHDSPRGTSNGSNADEGRNGIA